MKNNENIISHENSKVIKFNRKPNNTIVQFENGHVLYNGNEYKYVFAIDDNMHTYIYSYDGNWSSKMLEQINASVYCAICKGQIADVADNSTAFTFHNFDYDFEMCGDLNEYDSKDEYFDALDLSKDLLFESFERYEETLEACI